MMGKSYGAKAPDWHSVMGYLLAQSCANLPCCDLQVASDRIMHSNCG